MQPSNPSDKRLTTKQKRALVARAVLRPLLTATLLVAMYFVVPGGGLDQLSRWLVFIGVFVAFAIVATWQIVKIVSSDRPVLQGAEALASALPLYLLGFSGLYLALASSEPAAFSEPLSRMSSLYFTVTVFATVGFGDITALTDTTRAVVTIQIVCNLLVLGIGGRILYAAIEQGRRRRAGGAATDPESRQEQ